MACACAKEYTITLSDDGTVHYFGIHDEELGLGLPHSEGALEKHNNIPLPTPFPNLPRINMISCGQYFTVCVDHEGFIWSFGENNSGQLGTGDSSNVPQNIERIPNIPPVLSVACGADHTLIITNDSAIWSCGYNEFGQLCHGDTLEYRLVLQQTSFLNISKISAGFHHSLFQNNKGEIFACGYNLYGQCGLGHFNESQITPSLMPDTLPNIVQFVCGSYHNLFLDSEGNVFSVGDNKYGQLGLGGEDNENQNELNMIHNIPPIKTISCGYSSSYLIDVRGNLWSFGYNEYGQLGHGDESDINTPNMVNIEDIQHLSYGCCGEHFFAKNSQNQIFAAGNNKNGQLGIREDTEQKVSTLTEIRYTTQIWGSFNLNPRAKSARK